MALMIMNEKWTRWYRLCTRIICPFCVAIVPLIFYDLIAPAKETDDAVITGKTTYYRRGADVCNIEAKGHYTYREEVSLNVYRTAQVGDRLRVSLSPIFSEWKTMEVVRSGKVLVAARGSDLYWMGAIGLVFLLSLAAFLPERLLFANVLLVITIPVLDFAGVLILVRFLQLWTGQIEKM